MVDFKYVDGATVLPSDAEVKKLRPALGLMMARRIGVTSQIFRRLAPRARKSDSRLRLRSISR